MTLKTPNVQFNGLGRAPSNDYKVVKDPFKWNNLHSFISTAPVSIQQPLHPPITPHSLICNGLVCAVAVLNSKIPLARISKHTDGVAHYSSHPAQCPLGLWYTEYSHSQ